MGLCHQHDVDRLTRLLHTLGLPVSAPVFSLEDYLGAMGRDKKVRNGKLSLVLNCGLGDAVLKQVSDLKEIFSAALSS